MEYTAIFFVSALITLVVTVLILKWLIPVLASAKIGQKILDIGPRWHKSKEGTPTMGGIAFIVASILAFAVFFIAERGKTDTRAFLCALNVMVYAIVNALIGLIDDMAKMKKAQNEGLTPLAKYALQSVFAVLFLISLHFTVDLDTVLYIPYFNVEFDIGFWYYVLAYFLLCGVVNSVNLTDGIDGLAASVVLTVGLFFAFCTFTVLEDPIISFFSAIIIGSSVGFLVYNLHPAKVFMGDTGSLFLGALVVGMSFLINNILLVLVYGFVFICEAASDILQVGWFKLSHGKRIFKMAPLHHHFEECGWSEMKIVGVFSAINAIFCIIAFFGLGEL